MKFPFFLFLNSTCTEEDIWKGMLKEANWEKQYGKIIRAKISDEYSRNFEIYIIKIIQINWTEWNKTGRIISIKGW